MGMKASDKEAKVIISPRNITGKTTAFSFIVDDVNLGEVSAYEKEFELKKGDHSAHVQYMFMKSNSVRFHLEKGETAKLNWGVSLKFLFIPVILGLFSAVITALPLNPESIAVLSLVVSVVMPFVLIAIIILPGTLFTINIE